MGWTLKSGPNMHISVARRLWNSQICNNFEVNDTFTHLMYEVERHVIGMNKRCIKYNNNGTSSVR